MKEESRHGEVLKLDNRPFQTVEERAFIEQAHNIHFEKNTGIKLVRYSYQLNYYYEE